MWAPLAQPLAASSQLEGLANKLVFIAGFSAGSAGHTMSWCSLSPEWQFLTGFCVSAGPVKERIFQGCWVWAAFKARGACSSFHRIQNLNAVMHSRMNAMPHLYSLALFFIVLHVFLCVTTWNKCDWSLNILLSILSLYKGLFCSY